MSERYQSVLLFGPPGAGKGTQGKILSSIPGFFHSSSGDVFRRLNMNSDLGKVFLQYSSRGELVPDEITIKIWQSHLKKELILEAYKPAEDLLVLDGIPRTAEQARIMDQYIEVHKILLLDTPDEAKMIERLRRRALKEHRIDDTKETVIRNRWEVYRRETEPVLNYYPQHLIARINAQKSPAEVLDQILSALIPVQNSHFYGEHG